MSDQSFAFVKDYIQSNSVALGKMFWQGVKLIIADPDDIMF